MKFNDDYLTRLDSVVLDDSGWDNDEISIIISEQKDDYTRGYLTALVEWGMEGFTFEAILERLKLVHSFAL